MISKGCIRITWAQPDINPAVKSLTPCGKSIKNYTKFCGPLSSLIFLKLFLNGLFGILNPLFGQRYMCLFISTFHFELLLNFLKVHRFSIPHGHHIIKPQYDLHTILIDIVCNYPLVFTLIDALMAHQHDHLIQQFDRLLVFDDVAGFGADQHEV
jgi:hypothetical protein